MPDMDRQELTDALVEALTRWSETGGGLGSSFSRARQTSSEDEAVRKSREKELSATEKLIRSVQDEINARGSNNRAMARLDEILKTEEAARADLINQLDLETQTKLALYRAEKQLEEQTKALGTSAKKSVESVKDFGSALLDSKPGFEKYVKSITDAGNAAGDLASKFGKYGPLLEYTIKGLTKLNVAVLQQTDSLLKQSDELAKFGAAGQLTTKEILALAHQAGFTSKNMEGLFKSTKSLGTDILSLGVNVNEGTKSFAKVVERNDDVLAGFRRLGFSQEEFVKAQADSVKLLVQQGQVITKEMRDRGTLSKISAEYAQNLTVMSALTGETRDEMEKRVAQQRVEYNLAAKNSEMAAEKFRLEESLKTAQGEERISIENRIKDINELQKSLTYGTAMVESFLSKDQMKGFKEIATTGTITSEEGAALNLLLGGRGIELTRSITEAKSRAEFDKAMAAFQVQLGQGAVVTGERFGRLGTFTEEAKKLGQTTQTPLQMSMFAGKTFEELQRTATETRLNIEKTQRGTGRVAEDGAHQLRTFAETAGRSLQIFVDTMGAKFNPFVSGIGFASVGLVAFNVALGAATLRLARLGLPNIPGLPGGPTPPGGGATPPRGLASRIGMASGLGAVTALGAMALDAGSDVARKGGHEKTATALDITSSTAAMAGTGAALGSFIPGVGTIVGAGVGGALGLGYGFYKNFLKGGGNQGDEVSQQGDTPGAATGALVPPSPGGTLLRVAEAGKPEAVVPLPNGKNIPVEFKGKPEASTEEASTEQREFAELQKKNVEEITHNNTFLDKLTSTIISLEKVIKKQVEQDEEMADMVQGQIDGTGRAGGIISEIANLFGISRGKPFEGNKKEFTDKMYSTLLDQAKRQGVANPEVIAKLGTAQSTIETGYGKHLAGGQNYFGIKARPGEGGPSVATKEFINGRMVTVNDRFRKYGSMEESAADYIRFLQENPRYAKVLQSQSPEEAARLIRQAGYATDPNYSSKLMSVMSRMSPGETSVAKSSLPSTDGPVASTPSSMEVLPGAADGAILDGPPEFLARLHNREAVVPLNDPNKARKHLDALQQSLGGASSNVAGGILGQMGIENKYATKIGSRLVKKAIPEIAILEQLGGMIGQATAASDIVTDEKTSFTDKLIELAKLHPKVRLLATAYDMLKPFIQQANVASGTNPNIEGMAKPDLAPAESQTGGSTTSTIAPLPTSTTPTNTSPDTQAMMEVMTNVLASKFDEMLDKMNEANDIAGQQLRAVRT